ncbi:N6-adenosine-methyltransferase MT-A70-like protein [Scenedesmus sp. PABB004]|nr:N6-adenosine-methyltransferase MT-A70-like protein [Scenedesmus sp. PABB004]
MAAPPGSSLAAPAQAEAEGEAAALKALRAAELASLRESLAGLKSRFYDRQEARHKLSEPWPLLDAALGPPEPSGGPAEAEALRALGALAAAELLDPAVSLPMAVDALHKRLLAGGAAPAYRRALSALRHPDLGRLVRALALDRRLLTARALDLNGSGGLVITQPARRRAGGGRGGEPPAAKCARTGGGGSGSGGGGSGGGGGGSGGELGQLLTQRSVRERDRQEKGEELLALLERKTARQQEALQCFQTGGTAVREHCPHLTKEDCRRARRREHACHRLHQRKIVFDWTDPKLGNCTWTRADACRDIRRCRYVHYELDTSLDLPDDDAAPPGAGGAPLGAGGLAVPQYLQALPEPQWINCDIRNFEFPLLGKFGVIMTDPPWEIHQDVPYGTMSDQELLNMGIAELQDDGVIFMWVTGRALELGRELLAQWGYRRVDELIWVKTNALQSLQRSGRTGHWLNHTKEHCLVGYKGAPNINRFVDCDVLVSEVRETSRKPDEMYPLLERLSPGTRKLEIFARKHNVRPGWVSLGNQLDGTYLTDPELLARYTARYGQPVPPKEPPPRATNASAWLPKYGGDW